uniref:Uncharacterized protein n=1 Tax=Janibacter limosus TaxID=53458 RepID=A0AC61U3U2_9MICO|nr:hypothetical protein [Janibacter limosus]
MAADRGGGGRSPARAPHDPQRRRRRGATRGGQLRAGRCPCRRSRPAALRRDRTSPAGEGRGRAAGRRRRVPPERSRRTDLRPQRRLRRRDGQPVGRRPGPPERARGRRPRGRRGADRGRRRHGERRTSHRPGRAADDELGQPARRGRVRPGPPHRPLVAATSRWSGRPACTVTTTFRTPYVDGVGWAPQGREYLVVVAAHDDVPAVDGPAGERWNATGTLTGRLDGAEPVVAPVDVNAVNAGTPAFRDPDDPRMLVFEVAETGSTGDLVLRPDVDARPDDPTASGHERIRPESTVPEEDLR